MNNDCERCLKPAQLCLCADIPTLPSAKHVLILQHPQEPDKLLGSARLAHLALPNSTLKVGLSWPNLRAALGRAAPDRDAEAGRWAVLYLGSGVRSSALGSGVRSQRQEGIQFVSKNAEPLDEAMQEAIKQALEGIIVLDGTWSQAKALWWRNPWLLKLRRAVLTPRHESLYRELRREPRRECLSTIETIAESLEALGEPQETPSELRALFTRLLETYREHYPQKIHRRDYRRPRTKK